MTFEFSELFFGTIGGSDMFSLKIYFKTYDRYSDIITCTIQTDYATYLIGKSSERYLSVSKYKILPFHITFRLKYFLFSNHTSVNMLEVIKTE